MCDPEVYCAICGGPVVEVKISAETRSSDFKAAQPGEGQEIESEEYEWEKETYNGNIISEEEAQWTAEVMVLGFNTNTKALVNDAFLADCGTYDGFGSVEVSDPDLDSVELGPDKNFVETFQCYADLEGESVFEPVFPFHRPCYYVLRRRLGELIHGFPVVGSLVAIDKDILFGVMRSLADTFILNIDYGSPHPYAEVEGNWQSNAGEEIFAANPGIVKGLENTIRELICAEFFALSQGAEFDLKDGVRQDPFQRLPLNILLKIGEKCGDPTSLLNWAKASWYANIALRKAQQTFWATVIRLQMRWFFELLSCLDDGKLNPDSDTRAIFLWAEYHTKPRLGMNGGPFLRVSNRRRIWTSPCTKLADQYRSKLPPHLLNAQSDHGTLQFSDMVLSRAKWNRGYVVTHNEQARLYNKVHKCFWVDKWEDTYEKAQIIEAFFMQGNGFLTGISLTTEGGESRTVGSANESSKKVREAVIPAEDWICGMVVHIPAIELVGTMVTHLGETSPKGLTIICKSGREIHLGETNRGYPVRVLVARPGRQVIGLVAEMAADVPSATFTRLGLITLRNEELSGRRILHDHILQRRHRLIDEVMWKDDGSGFFGAPYWNNPSIQISHRDEFGPPRGSWETEIHQQLVPQEPLIWAKDATELRRLKRVSIFTTYSHTSDIKGVEAEVYSICGLGVNFEADHTEDRRVIGIEGKIGTAGRKAGLSCDGPHISPRAGTKLPETNGNGDFRVDLDIDGPGGEIITEVFLGFGQYKSLDGLKFRTNRGRETECLTTHNRFYSRPNAIQWLSIESTPNKTIVGIMATFARGGPTVTGNITAIRTYKELTSLVALSMALGIDEETGEVSDQEDEEEDEGESDVEAEETDDEMNDEDE